MEKNSTHSYREVAGKNARLVASWASTGDLLRAIKLAPNACGECELMHPQLWRTWYKASPQAFRAVISLMNPREVAVLSKCLNSNDRSVVDFFAEQPEKLTDLSLIGIHLNRPESTELWGCKIDPGLSQVGRVNVAGMLGLAAAGVKAPGLFSLKIGDILSLHLSNSQQYFPSRTALQLLAISPRFNQMATDACESALQALQWLATGVSPGLRNAEGRNALGMAVDAGCAHTAKLLLSMGLDPMKKDNKERDVMEILLRRATVLAKDTDPMRVQSAKHLQELKPYLLASMECRGLDLASSMGQKDVVSKRLSL